MALIAGSSYNPQNLQDVLGQQAQSKIASSQDQYVQNRRKLVSQQAATGRLGSGVTDYNLGDLANTEASNESGIYSDLASKLGSIPADDSLDQQNYNQSLSLAQQIGLQNRPSKLQEALGVLGGVGHIFCGGYVENECLVVDKTTGEKGIMAERGPELIIRLDAIGLTKEDVAAIGLVGPMAGFDVNGITNKMVRELLRKGLERVTNE